MSTHDYSVSTGAMYMDEKPLYRQLMRYFRRPRHSSFSILDSIYQMSQPLVKWFNSLAEIQEA